MTGSQPAGAWNGFTPAARADAPRQHWGAAGHGTPASAAATATSLKGSHRAGAPAPGQAAPATGAMPVDLGTPASPAPQHPVAVPAPRGTPSVKGFESGSSAEVVSKRQQRSRTYRNEDGTYTTRFYAEDVNFRAKDGSWQPIDPTLVRPDGRGLNTMDVTDPGWQTRSTQDPVAFGGTADADPLATVSLDADHSIGYALEDASAATGRTDGATVTYPDARPDADLQFLAGDDSVKESIVLKGKGAPTVWRFPLDLQGLTASVDAQGAVVYSDAAGDQRAWTPPGWMEDADLDPDGNEGAVSSGVTYGIEQDGGRQVLVVTLDKDWLDAPGRVFPVRVDPSVKSVDATSGTYVESPYDQSFSSDTVLKAGTYDGGSHKAAAFLRFTGLETTLKNAYVEGADLALYNTWSDSCTAKPVSVYPITSNWSEGAVTKYPGPATGASLASKSFAHGWRPEGTTTWSCKAAWESIKLGSAGRKLVDDWTHGRKKNYGLAVKASTTDSKAWKQFGSDDYPNGKPSLDVTWTTYGAAYKLGDFTTPVTATAQGVEKVTVTNEGQATWPKGGNYKLRYRLYDANDKEITDSSKIAYTEMPQDVSPGESVTLDAKIAPLAPATYTVMWSMTDYSIKMFTDDGVPGASVKLSAVNIPPQLTAESPGSGTAVDSLTPTLWANGRDPDLYPKSALQYSFEVCQVEGSNTRENCKQGPRGDSRQWAVPASWLTWGKTYAWYAYTYDGSATSTRPGPALFTTQVPQPAVTSHLGGADGSSEVGSRDGNYVTSATDAAVTTVGPQLSVERTYNSLDPRTDGAFGVGWSTPWDMRVRNEPETHTVLVTRADGSQVRFGTDSDGGYAPPPGIALDLKKQTDGTWVLRDRTGATYTFLAGGELSRVTDGAGRVQEVTRSGPDGGDLVRATDELSGRFLSFTWSDGHIATVTTSPVDKDTSGLTWSYHYQGNELTAVCGPGSDGSGQADACTGYDYTDGSVYRSDVLDASPTSYWRLGESDGSQAASDAPSATGLNNAEYHDVQLGTDSALAGTTDTSVAFDGESSAVQLPASTLKGAAYPAIEMWFKTATPTAVLAGFQNGELGSAPASYRSVLTIDPAGKLRGQFILAGANGKLSTPVTTPEPVTDGEWHYAVLTATSTGQSLYLDGAYVGSLAGPVDEQARDYAYLGAGRSSTGWMGVDPGDYYFKGEMDDVAVYNHTLDAATIAEHYAARTALGRITKVTLPSGRVHASADYDSGSGRLISYTDANGGAWQVSAPSYSTASASYAGAVEAAAPTGYWRLGDRTGSLAADARGEDEDGTYGDGVRLGTPGIFSGGDDTAAQFGGAGAVEVPSEALGTAAAQTMELWFSTTSPGVLVSNQDTDLDTTPGAWRSPLVVGSDGKLHGRLTPSVTAIVSKSKVTDGQWHHALLAGNGAIQALFVDGVFQGSVAGGADTVRHEHTYIGGGYTSVGWSGDATAHYSDFTGQIDEVAFYDKPLANFVQSGSTWKYSADAATDIAGQRIEERHALLAGTGEQYRGAVVSDAPTAYWRLGESQGTRLASMTGGGAMDATLHPDAGSAPASTLGTSGVFGSDDDTALTLSKGGYAQLPGTALNGATAVSLEMWFRTSAASQILMSFQNVPLGQEPTSWRPALNVDGDGKLRGELLPQGITSADPIISAAPVDDGAWHHVVLSGDTTGQALYLDGVKVGSKTGAISDQGRDYAYLGGGWGSSGWMGLAAKTYSFEGDIDEAAFYRSALDADQVAAQYEAEEEPAASALTATVTLTDPARHTSSTGYDALHGAREISHTDASGGVTGYSYDVNGFVYAVTDPDGHTTVTGHDARGNTVSSTTCRDTDSCWTSYTSYYVDGADPLDPRNDKVTDVRDARSADAQDTRYRIHDTYDEQGRITSTERPDGTASTTTYTDGTEPALGGGDTPAGLVAETTTAGGSTTTYRYDAKGDLIEDTAPSGLETGYSYDGLGRTTGETQTSDSEPDGVTTTYTYDAADHVVTETGPPVRNEVTGVTHTGKITRTYDPDGLLTSETTEDTSGGDPARTTSYHYDDHGLNDSVTDPEQQTTKIGYDAFGRRSGTTDAVGTHYTYTYTPTGQPAETILDDWTGDPSGTTRDLVLSSDTYDPAGRLATSTDAMGATTAYTYYDDGLAATTTAKQVTQADGTRHDIVLESDAYDPAGNLTRQVTGAGATTQTYTVDALGRTTAGVLDPDGLDRATTYTYDGDDRVTTRTQSIGSGDNGARLTTSVTYDAAGDVTRQTVDNGTDSHTVTATYDERGLTQTTVSARGNAPGADPAALTTRYTYDALGRAVQQIAPRVEDENAGGTAKEEQPTTTVGFDTFGDETQNRDALGHVTTTAYDSDGRTSAVTLPAYTPPDGAATFTDATTTYRYDALGDLLQVTDPLQRTTGYTYDQLGHPLTRTDPPESVQAAFEAREHEDPDTLSGAAATGGGVSHYTWTPTGLQLSATDPTGALTEATYDEVGRQLTATAVERRPAAADYTTRYGWDDAGNETSSTTPAGVTSFATYDPAGEVLTITDGGGTTHIGYDGLGRRISVTDPTGRRTTTAYDALGDTTATTDYGTGTTPVRTTAAEFDADGNRTADISAPKARTTYTYDTLGRMTDEREPVSDAASIHTTFGYDADGDRTRMTDGRGSSTTYTYNSWGLPESTVEPATDSDPSPADRTWTTSYDIAGQAVTDIEPGGVRRTSAYNGLGLPTHETGTGAESATTDRDFGYDLAGRMTSAGAADGTGHDTFAYDDRGLLLSSDGPEGQVDYGYDADGDLTSRTTGGTTTTYAYDGYGRLSTSADPLTGGTVDYGYDSAGRLTSQSYAAAQSATGSPAATAVRSYGYDDLGRLVSDTTGAPGGGPDTVSTTYGYDPDDRLTAQKTTGTAGAGDSTYAYDDAGRLTEWTDDGVTTDYGWDEAGNRTKAGDVASTFDARNQQLTDGSTTFSYTPRGTLASVDTGSGAPRTLSFDAFDRKTQDGSSAYTYDSLDRLEGSDGDGFTYDGGSGTLLADGATDYTRAPDGTLQASAPLTAGTANPVAPGTGSWAQTDQHTDVVDSLSPDGTQVTGSTAYDPFGTVSANAGTTSALGYQSGWTDPTTGDVATASRWYQPGEGTFDSRDSVTLDPDPSGQANRYAYADGDPMDGADPSGHCIEDLCIGEGIAVWGLGTLAAGYASEKLSHTHISVHMPSFSWPWSHSSSSSHTTTSHTTTSHAGSSGAAAALGLYDWVSGIYSLINTVSWALGQYSSYAGSHGGYSTPYHYAGTYGYGGYASFAPTARPVPPPPPIDQNPNNGKHPDPAPTRPTPEPDWNGKNNGWKPGDTVTLIVTAAQMLEAAHDHAYDPTVTVDPGTTPEDSGATALDELRDMFPDESIDPRAGQGDSGTDPNARRTRSSCERDFPSSDPSFLYAPMTRFGPGPNDCRATGAVAQLDAYDLRAWRLDPKWKPAGFDRLPAGNRAALHLIGNQMGGANDTLRNFVAGYQTPANSPDMRSLEDDVTNAVKGGQHVQLGVLPVYRGSDPAIPDEIKMYGVGDAGYGLNCTVYNRPTGGYNCSERTSGGPLARG